MLSPEQRKTLLRIARESIAAVLGGHRPAWTADDFDEDLRRPSGAFVTLTEGGELRGCIGSIVPTAPLFQAVSQSAINAAFRDPRFYPVQQGELDRLHVEISVMGPITVVEDLETIVPGRDGLIVSKGGRAGLLLPQVATEYGWNRETFLAQTCVKAGLPPTAWRVPGTRIERFSAEVFGEETSEK
ncbi:MAG TPA: AmmeMemoRadiSam system protein A [Thermoanaerobaculia bacterium]|nr:AmmeMemoRadiSam system protein A [Thermoanaerobaculia bacterium]